MYTTVQEKQYCNNTDNWYVFFFQYLKSNNEVEYIIINPWRVCVGARKKQVEPN